MHDASKYKAVEKKCDDHVLFKKYYVTIQVFLT